MFPPWIQGLSSYQQDQIVAQASSSKTPDHLLQGWESAQVEQSRKLAPREQRRRNRAHHDGLKSQGEPVAGSKHLLSTESRREPVGAAQTDICRWISQQGHERTVKKRLRADTCCS